MIAVCLPSFGVCEVIKADTVWSGEISLTEDVLVPEGVTITIMPGTIVRISPAESTKTDPEYLSPLTEITIRGALRAGGNESSPIRFSLAGKGRQGGWAGLIVDGGAVVLNSVRVHDAETGVYVMKGTVSFRDLVLTRNYYGLTVQGRDSVVRGDHIEVKENEYGVFVLNGAQFDVKNDIIEDNKKRGSFTSKIKEKKVPVGEYKAEKTDREKVYNDDVMLGNTVWEGRIEIRGTIRVPEKSRLVIMPGTVVEFRKKDTNNDGVGENGLMVQGVIIAKGTREKPIIFRSAETQKRMGDWDAVNIMNSDGAQNLIEYCQVEDAYRGLHFHFSNVAVVNSVIKDNFRGVQFQESVVEMTGTHIYGNKSGVQARDSEVFMSGNSFFDNYSGMVVFRANVTFKGNNIMNNYREGLKLREAIIVVEENLFDGNRYGLMSSDLNYGNISRNVLTRNLEQGLLLKNSDNIEIAENFIQGNGFSGINIQNSRAAVKGNHISENGDRGIALQSFDVTMDENEILKNEHAAISLGGALNISASGKWWGSAVIEYDINEKDGGSRKARVEYKRSKAGPVLFAWPLKTISTDITWHGDIYIGSTVQVLAGAVLKISPESTVIFAEGTGLKVHGKLIAAGETDGRITFTSLKKNGASGWGEILLEHAEESLFSNCAFENATWGIHSHFSGLKVAGCTFRNNYGGVRFMSGPVEISGSVFEKNTIGIRAYMGSAAITDNVITMNETGIFVREKGGGLKIRGNNLFANSSYNIRAGDFNDEDIDARYNWWGKALPQETIFDENKEPGIGKVIYEPYAREPFKIK